MGFPGGSAGKESTCNAGDMGSIPGLGRSPGDGKWYPLQCCGLETSMDYIVHGVAMSQTQLSNFHLNTYYIYNSIFEEKNNLLPISILTPLPNSYIKCTLTFGHNSTSFLVQGFNKKRKCKETWLEHIVEWKEIYFLSLLRIINSCLPRKILVVTYCYGQKQSESGLRHQIWSMFVPPIAYFFELVKQQQPYSAAQTSKHQPINQKELHLITCFHRRSSANP